MPPKATKTSKILSALELQEERNFCWICHKSTDDTFLCTRCPRVFHLSCLSEPPKASFICPECATIGRPWVGAKPLSHYISKIIESLNTEICPRRNKNLRYCVNKQFLSEKNFEGSYQQPQVFISEVRWILHNAMICFGEANKKTTQAKNFVSMCEHIFEDIEFCEKCHPYFYDTKVKLTDPCEKHHPPVFAKTKDGEFWPCKALYRTTEDLVICFLFGVNQTYSVSNFNIRSLSKGKPEFKSVGKNKQMFKAAMVEFNKYVRNLEERIGPLVYYPKSTPFKTEVLPGPPGRQPPAEVHMETDVESSQQTTGGLGAMLVPLETVSHPDSTSNDRLPSARCRDLGRLFSNPPSKLAAVEMAEISCPLVKTSQNIQKYRQQLRELVDDPSTPDRFRTVGKGLCEELEDMYSTVSQSATFVRKYKAECQGRIEDLASRYQCLVREFMEVQTAYKQAELAALKQELERRFAANLLEAKRTTWCHVCSQAAATYCCQLIFYCGAACQQRDWPLHQGHCQRPPHPP